MCPFELIYYTGACNDGKPLCYTTYDLTLCFRMSPGLMLIVIAVLSGATCHLIGAQKEGTDLSHQDMVSDVGEYNHIIILFLISI